jgi:hypothetical protein
MTILKEKFIEGRTSSLARGGGLLQFPFWFATTLLALFFSTDMTAKSAEARSSRGRLLA